MKYRAAWAVWVLAICQIVAAQEAGLDQGLVAYYRFDDSLQDSAGQGLQGVAQTGQMPGFVDGYAGRAANFDGVDDAVRFPGLDNAVFSADFSLAWFMRISQHRKYSLLGKRDACSLSNHFDVRNSATTPSQVHFELSARGQNPTARGDDLSLNQWVHIAVVREGNAARVYTDGVAGAAVALPALDFSAVSAALGISTSPCIAFGDGTRRFQGGMDELRVYRRALTAAQVAALAEGDGIGSSGGVVVSPSVVGAGGHFVLSAANPITSTGAPSCRARLGLGGALLGPVAVSASGEVRGELTLPSASPPGIHAIQLECATTPAAGHFQIGHDSLEVGEPIQLALESSQGFAGQGLGFSASGIIGRSLELWFGGRRVHGPVPVSAGRASGVFSLPQPPPTVDLPINGVLEARGYSGRVLTSSGGVALTQRADPGFRVRLDSVQMPAAALPQTRIPISGRIVVASGLPQSRTINVFFRGADDRVIPLGSRDVVTDSQGRFSLQIELPSLATLDGYVARGRGELFFTFTEIDPATGSVRTITQVAGPLDALGYAQPAASARVEVRVTGNTGGGAGTPLAGAYVVIGGGSGSALFDDPGADAGLAAVGPLNQFSINRPNPMAYQACPLSLAAGYTDANGLFTAELSANQVREWLMARSNLLRAVCSTDINAPHCVSVQGVEAGVEVFTAHLGFGVVQGGVALSYEFPAEFVPAESGSGGRFIDPRSGQAWNSGNEAWRISVSAPPITPALAVQPFRRRTMNDGPGSGAAGDNYLPLTKVISGGILRYQPRPAAQFDLPPEFPPCTDAPDADPCVKGPPGAALELSYFHDINVAGTLQPGYPRLVMCANGGFDCSSGPSNTVPLVRDPMQPEGLAACGQGLQRYSVGLPTSVRTPNDPQLRGRIEVRSEYDPPGPISNVTLQGRANVQLRLEPLPAWFYVAPGQGQPSLRLTQRQITRNPNGSLTFEGDEDLSNDGRGAPGRDVSSSNNQFTAVNLASPQRSATRSGRHLRRTQMNRTEGVFEEAMGLSSDNDVANNSARPVAPAANSLRNPQSGSLQTEVIIDTGKLPLFRFTYGVPPIADATLGADFWLQAGLSYGGVFDAAAEVPQLTFLTEPYSRFGVDLFFDLSAIGGLVSASAEASARAYLANRARYANGVFDADNYQCFGLNVDVVLEICALFCTSIGDTLVSVYEARPDTQFNRVNCQGSTLALPGFPLAAPAPGQLFANTVSGLGPRPSLRPQASSSLGFDLQGSGSLMRVDRAGRLLRERLPLCRAAGCTTVVESAGSAVTSTATAAIGAGAGISIWSYVPGSPTSINQATAQQHLRWARYSGNGAQHSPQNLTPPGSGDGSVVVGVCPQGRGACPAGGEVTAVWLRRLGASWDAHSYALMTARYRPATGWTTPVRLDPAQGAASDLQPTVAYRTSTGTPIVVWVRKPSAGLSGLDQRRIAYRFLDGSSPVRLANELPAGVSWPSATTRFVAQGQFSVEQLVLAFTVNVDPVQNANRPKAFIGNTNALNMARCTLGGSGTCSFVFEELRDRFGRNLRVEKPNAMVDGSGALAVAFNGLGFGPDAQGESRRVSDPIGMLSGQGAAVIVRPRLDGSPVSLLDLDVSAIGGFRNAAAFNPVLDSFEMVSQPIDFGVGGNVAEAMGAIGKSLGLRPLHKGSALALDDAMRFVSLGAGADLRIEALSANQRRLQPGQPVTVDVRLSNLGRAYVPAAAGDLELVATWDGPYGSRPSALLAALPGLAMGEVLQRQLQVPVPEDFDEDEAHTLVVTLRAAAEAGETDTSDNAARLVFGSLPGATAVQVSFEPGEPMVYLSWQSEDPEDSRVVGWRVLRIGPQGERLPLGSTPVRGFVDLSAAFDESREYVVIAYAANGLESAESAPVQARPVRQGLRGEAVFNDGFEARQ